MTYQTKSWHFYWERLGYENNSIPSQREHVARSVQGYSSEKPSRTAAPEPPAGASTESATTQKPMG